MKLHVSHGASLALFAATRSPSRPLLAAVGAALGSASHFVPAFLRCNSHGTGDLKLFQTAGEQHSNAAASINMSLPPLSSIAGAKLRTMEGTEIDAAELWKTSPVFVYAIRRPGCVLCRDEAQKLWTARAQLEDAGLRVVCVVHEWIDREIAAFVPTYWGGDVYHDADRAFYKLFGENGTVRTASSLGLLNPFNPAWGRIMAARRNVKDSNVVGESSILGGLVVVRKGAGGIAWMHAEVGFGDFPATEDVITAARAAVRA